MGNDQQHIPVEAIRRATRELHHHTTTLQTQLDAGTITTKTHGETHRQKTKKSNPPLNTNLLNYLIEEVDPYITGWAMTLAQTTNQPPPRRTRTNLTRYLLHNTNTIAQAEWKHDYYEEITELNTHLHNLINPPDAAQAIHQRQTARSICYRLNNAGYPITPAQLHRMRRSGHITVEKTTSGRSLYSLNEVMTYIMKNNDT